MPAPYGLQSTGFSLKSFDEIRVELENRLTSIFGPVDVSPESQFGQLIAAFGEMLATNWQGQQALWSAGDPRTASGLALDNMSSLIGMTRLQATSTQVIVRFTGVNGTIIPATTTRVSIDGGEIFFTTTSGTVSGGFADVLCEAVNPGNVKAFANTITVLNTPISGISGVNNPADPTLQGQDEENADRLRARRNLLFQALGRDSVTAIRATLLGLAGVTDCYVFENSTDVTDASGLPPHSFEVVLSGGVDADIAEAIFDLKRSGIATHGTTTVSVNDSQGESVAIKFSRPADINIYMEIDVVADSSLFPTNGATLIKEAIINFVNGDIRQGSEVRASRYIPTVFTIDGVMEVAMPRISAFPVTDPVSSATLVFTNRQLPKFDTTRITVTVTLV